MSDKKKKLGDFITVALAKGTRPIEIKRDSSMSDAEWERVKKSAHEAGTLLDTVGSMSSGLDGADAPVDLKKAVPLKDQVADIKKQITDEEASKKYREDHPAEKPSLVQEVVREVKRAINRPGETRATVESDARHQDAQTSDTFTGPRPDIPVDMKDARAGRDRPDLSLDEPRTGVVRVKRWFPEGSAEVSPGVVKVPQETGPDGLPRTPVFDPGGVSPPESQASNMNVLEGMRHDLNSTVAGAERSVLDIPGKLARGVVNTIMPDEANPAQNADPLDVAPAQVATQPGAPQSEPAPAPGTPPPGAGGSFSASLKTRTPGSGVLPPAGDPHAEEDALMRRAALRAHEAENLRVDVERKRNEADSKILEDKIGFTAENENKRLAAVKTFDDTLAQEQQATNSISDERRQLMNQKVDPDAYYTKGGVGRAIAATISGALFGWTGQGMQFLQRMDSLAQQEVKNQQDELARKSSELSLIAQDKKNVFAMAKERGMNSIQSIAMAKVNFYESVKDQLAKVAADNPQFAAEQAKRSAEIDGALAGEITKLKTATQMEAHQKVMGQAALMNAGANMMDARTKAAGAGGAGMQGMKPSQQKDIQGLLAVGKQIGEMSKQWNEQAGDPTAALKQFMGFGMEATDASKWKNSSSKFHAQTVGTVLEKGKLTDADFPKYLDSFIPSAGNTKAAAVNRINNLVKYAVTQYTAELNSLDAAAVKYNRLPSPAEYQQMVVQQINESGGGGSVPGEKPYGAR